MSHIPQIAGITNRITTWKQTTMEVVNVHVGPQTASLSTCFLSSLSYVTINHETISFVVEIKYISFLCEIFSFQRGEYKCFSCLERGFMQSADNHLLFQETYYLPFHIRSAVRKNHNIAFISFFRTHVKNIYERITGLKVVTHAQEAALVEILRHLSFAKNNRTAKRTEGHFSQSL